MKKLIKLQFIFLATFFVILLPQAFADVGPTPPVPVDPTVAAPSLDETQANKIARCDEAEQRIKNFCTQNPELALAQQKAGWLKSLGTETGVGTNVISEAGKASSTRMSLAQIRKACSAATNKCFELCADEGNKHLSSEASYRSSMPPQTAAADKEKAEADRKNNIQKTCKAEYEAMNAAVSGLDMQLVEIIQALAALAQSLGIGKDFDAAVADPGTDDCDGENADLLIKCLEQSGPKGTRAGLNGIASLNGKPSGGLDGLFAESESGEPGGEQKDIKKNNAFTGSGVGRSGLGGLGTAGTNSGSSSGSSNKDGDLKTDIGGGFMGVGGGGSGGFSSGGGSASRAGGFARYSLGNSKGLSKAGLQKKLNKYAKGNSRAPASAGGANGPFEDNWSVVNKAYKKNSTSMFHQK